MNKDSIVKKEFFLITKILPLRRINLLKDNQARRDAIFPLLADKVFDHPELLGILKRKVKEWLKKDKSEFTYLIVGYTYYLSQNFKQAEACLFKALEKNPRNLDIWFDFAFSLYHQGKAKHELAKEILFNYDYFARGKAADLKKYKKRNKD